ncbi:hypothetical protein LMH73_004700 [Vibrio splendidus]|nr:hypothetical protein [Vibrio splendidus]MCC4882528.1 hypothetical protein [Vibrio splendidus]
MANYLSQFEKDNALMKRLNLLDEFNKFRGNQSARNISEVQKHEKTMIGSAASAMATTLGAAGLMVAGVLSTPLLVAGGGIVAGCLAVAAYSKHKSNDLSMNGSSKITANAFLNRIDDHNKSFGNKQYEEFVASTLKDNPELADKLSSVSSSFSKKADMPRLQPALEVVTQEFSNIKVGDSEPTLYSSEQAEAARKVDNALELPVQDMARKAIRESGLSL